MNCLILLLKQDILGHFCKVVTHSSMIFNKKRRDVLYFIGAKQKYTFERDCGCFAYNSSSLFPSSGLHQTLQLRRHVTQYSIRSPLSEFTLTSYSPPPNRLPYRLSKNRLLFALCRQHDLRDIVSLWNNSCVYVLDKQAPRSYPRVDVPYKFI